MINEIEADMLLLQAERKKVTTEEERRRCLERLQEATRLLDQCKVTLKSSYNTPDVSTLDS